jgi:hypothetical protein
MLLRLNADFNTSAFLLVKILVLLVIVARILCRVCV